MVKEEYMAADCQRSCRPVRGIGVESSICLAVFSPLV
jgi:hypothetical protein